MQSINEILEQPALLVYFSGASNYTWLHFQTGERRLLSRPISYFEEQLPGFIRIHKTALVNPACVASLERPAHAKAPGSVCLHDGTELPVSRRRWPEISQQLRSHRNVPGPAVVLPDGQSVATDKLPDPDAPYVPPPLIVLAVMSVDALLLTQERIEALELTCALQHLESGEALATSLLLSPVQEWPALIILDARINRADRFLALRALKGNARLRAIPVIWLAAPGDDIAPAYGLDANSVVSVADRSAAFAQVIDQLCRYWLLMVQLPPKAN